MSECTRCRDCKYFQKWRHSSEVIEKYGQLYSCELLVITDPSPDDYCSKAKEKEELKIGHWEHVKDKSGKHYIRCSCCEYTEPEYITFSREYCPNCGTKMEV